MDGAAFHPTHSTPADGLVAWDAPDPTRASTHRLDPDLPIEVLEETTGWAHVRCSNGWTTWIDASKLVEIPFRLTRAVPAGGLDAREVPEASRPADARLAPDLPVEVIEESQGWARVRCSNGWETWVDGRALVPVGAGSRPATSLATLSLGGAFAAIALPAVAVMVGSVLAWFSAGGESVNAWDIELAALFTHDAGSLDLKTGPVLLVLALGALLLIPARPPARALTISLGVLGGLMFGLGALGVILYLDLPDPRPDLGIGMLLTMTGGLALAAGGFIAPRQAVRTAPAPR